MKMKALYSATLCCNIERLCERIETWTVYLAIISLRYEWLKHVEHMDGQWRSGLQCRRSLRSWEDVFFFSMKVGHCFIVSKTKPTTAAVLCKLHLSSLQGSGFLMLKRRSWMQHCAQQECNSLWKHITFDFVWSIMWPWAFRTARAGSHNKGYSH